MRPWRRRGSRGYVVCATPRCGSNYLCQLLASTGVLGDPREYFNLSGRRHYDDDPGYPADPGGQLERVLTTGRTPNGVYGVYGVKIHPLLGELPAGVDPLAELPLLHVVRMVREDRLGQALSWTRAQQSGQFRASDAPAAPVHYERDHVTRSLRFLAGEEAEWDRRLAGHALAEVTVSYEELVSDPQATVDRVARLMGLRGRACIDAARVTVGVQRDPVSEDWRRRFLAD